MIYVIAKPEKGMRIGIVVVVGMSDERIWLVVRNATGWDTSSQLFIHANKACNLYAVRQLTNDNVPAHVFP